MALSLVLKIKQSQRKKKKKRRRFQVRPCLLNEEEGASINLLMELRLRNADHLRHLQINTSTFIVSTFYCKKK